MLRQILMLMALLSGLSALCAPEQALAAQDHASQVEAGSSADGEEELVSYAVIFGPVQSIAGVAERPLVILASDTVDAPRVAIGVDRARE